MPAGCVCCVYCVSDPLVAARGDSWPPEIYQMLSLIRAEAFKEHWQVFISFWSLVSLESSSLSNQEFELFGGELECIVI